MKFPALGSVIVIAVLLAMLLVAPAPGPENDCVLNDSPLTCFTVKTQHMAASGDIQGALTYAAEIIAPYNRNITHFAEHTIGHAAYENLGNRAEAMALLPPEALTNEHYLSYEGYQHGLLQAYFATEKSHASMDSLIEESCGEFYVPENIRTEDYTWRERRQCFHGVGHALLYAYENDLNQALDVCRRLPYEWITDRCTYGVFMELSYLYNPDYMPTSPRPFVEGESMAPVCLSLPDFQSKCMNFVGRSYLLGHKEDDHLSSFESAFEACNALPPPSDRACRNDVAEIPVTSAGEDFMEIQRRCKTAGTYEVECLMRAASGILSGYGGEPARRKFLLFCASLGISLSRECALQEPV